MHGCGPSASLALVEELELTQGRPMNSFMQRLDARRDARVLRQSISAMLLAGLGFGTSSLGNVAHADTPLAAWNVEATYYSGGDLAAADRAGSFGTRAITP